MSEEIAKRVEKLEEAIIGSTEKEGLMEMMREQSRTAIWMREKLCKIEECVDELKGEKQKIRGIIAGASAAGGVLGYLASWFTGKH